MADRVQVYVGDSLYRRARQELGDDFNWSAGFRSWLEEKLAGSSDCQHTVLMCRDCRREVDTGSPPADPEGVAT